MPLNFGVQFRGSSGTAIFHYFMAERNITMPTFTIGSGTSVTLSNQPTYQQLITITNPSSYGINTVNSPGSNVQFTAQNGTLLYAWEQSINSGALQVWVKNYYGNSVIDMQVLPSFENLFSATGYLGEAPQLSSIYAEYDNGIYVFGQGNYYNFISSSQLSGWTDSSITYTVSDGLHITGDTSGLSALYNASTSFQVGEGIGIIGNLYEPNANYWTLTGVSSGDTTNFIGIAGSNAINTNGAGEAGYVRNATDSTNTQILSTYNGTNSFFVQTESSTTTGFWLNGTYQFSLSMNNASYPYNYALSVMNANGGSYTLPNAETIYSYFIVQDGGSMPTFNIGTGSVFQANATADNTTSQHYASFGADSTNLTDGEYTYSIPDSFNSNYITIYYNPAWTIDYASYGFAPGVQATSSGTTPYLTFAGVSGIGTLTMTFTEPLTIGQPLGTMSLGVLPSVAVGGDSVCTKNEFVPLAFVAVMETSSVELRLLN